MLRLRDLMTRDVHTASPEMTLREAAELFAQKHISCAPVMAGHSLIGVVSVSDLLEFASTNETRAPFDDGRNDDGEDDEPTDDPSALYFLEAMPAQPGSDYSEPLARPDDLLPPLFSANTVADVMTRDVCSMTPDAFLTDAAQYMWKAGVHHLVVLEGDRLAGIVSTSDVSRAVAMQNVDLSEDGR